MKLSIKFENHWLGVDEDGLQPYGQNLPVGKDDAVVLDKCQVDYYLSTMPGRWGCEVVQVQS